MPAAQTVEGAGEEEPGAGQSHRQVEPRRLDPAQPADPVHQAAQRGDLARHQVAAAGRGLLHHLEHPLDHVVEVDPGHLALRPDQDGEPSLQEAAQDGVRPLLLARRAVDQARVDRVDPHPLLRPLLDGELARVLGGAVEGGEGRLEGGGLVRHRAVWRAAAEVGHRGDREEAADAELVGQRGDVLAPLDVGPPHPLLRPGQVEVGGGVDHPVGAGHPLPHRGAVRHVAGEGGDAEPLQGLRVAGGADQRPHLAPGLHQPAGQGAADVTGAAGQEDPHAREPQPTRPGPTLRRRERASREMENGNRP